MMVRSDKLSGRLTRCGAILLTLLLAVAWARPVSATEQTSRLKACLQNEELYYVTTISYLNRYQKNDKEAFKAGFDKKHVAVSGTIAERYSVRSAVLADEDGERCLVSAKGETLNRLKGLEAGSRVMVYSRLTVNIPDNDSIELEAVEIDVDPEQEFDSGDYVYYGDGAIKGSTVSGITADGRGEYMIPMSWRNGNISRPLTNNGVKGRQYFLSALGEGEEHPELFYMFYFLYETYLENPPKSADAIDKKNIECEIIKNILGKTSINALLDIKDVKDDNGKEMNYYNTSFHGTEGDYRLEFIFRPDPKGITCMLYLYYPQPGSYEHYREVAYVIENMKLPE